MADTDPVGPYGATVAGVKALVPEARVPVALAPGDRGVTEAQVTAWVAALSGRVDLRATGWRRLRAVATAEELAAGEQAPRARFATAAADLVHQGAASYLEAARFPERARPADTSYAGVLWQRFTDGLADLVGWLTVELDRDAGTELVVDAVDSSAGGAAYSFPAPSFTPDTMRW